MRRQFTQAPEDRHCLASFLFGEDLLEVLKTAIEGRDESNAPAIVLMLCENGEVRQAAQRAGCEVWYFETQDDQLWPGFEGYAAIASRAPVSQIALMSSVQASSKAHLIGLAECRTHETSPELNRAALLRSGLRLIAEALDKEESASQRIPFRYEAPPSKCQTPGVVGCAGIAFRSLWTSARSRIVNESGRVQWAVGMVPAQKDTDICWDGVQWIDTPSDRFLADPFPLDWKGRTYLFVEEYLYEKGKGTIGVLEWDDSDSPLIETVMEQPFHLSFPNVFENEGELYMLPEQAESNQLVLYRCHGFPGDWRPHSILLENQQAADPVLLYHDSYWWLMFSRADYSSHDNNLQLYYASQLEGPFTRHPKSPVRETLRGSRMAGWIIHQGDSLIRPGQDCSKYYGGATRFHRIDQLDPENYRETPIKTLQPDTGTEYIGTHTYNRIGDLVAVDAFRFLNGVRR